MSAPGERMVTETQALAIRVLQGKLGRTCPELADLTWQEAGDLIIKLRDETARVRS